MRSHLGCTGAVNLGSLIPETQKRLETIAASWLEYSPETAMLDVRHVQPDDIPPVREVGGELMGFLHALSAEEREQIPGGALYYQDESSGQYVRLKVWWGGFLTVAWARPDYAQSQWQAFQNQPMSLVFEPYQRLNGRVTFEAGPSAGDQLRKIIDSTAGEYSQGDYAISTSISRIDLTLRDVNADALSLLNALRYTALPGTLDGVIDLTSFRFGDMEDYCRFSLRADGVYFARPMLWSDTPNDLTTRSAYRADASRAAA